MSDLEIDEAAWQKFDEGLRRALLKPGAKRDSTFPVLITVARTRDEADDRQATSPQAAADAFERDAQPIVDKLRGHGVTSVKPLWISRALSATLPVAALLVAAADERTSKIILMIPMKLIPEGHDHAK